MTSEFDAFGGSPGNLIVQEPPYSSSGQEDLATGSDSSGLQVTCFTEIVDEVTLHFQIIRLPKQIYAWVSCNSAKLGHLYAAAPTRPNNTASVSCLLGGVSDNTGSGIGRRLGKGGEKVGGEANSAWVYKAKIYWITVIAENWKSPANFFEKYQTRELWHKASCCIKV